MEWLPTDDPAAVCLSPPHLEAGAMACVSRTTPLGLCRAWELVFICFQSIPKTDLDKDLFPELKTLFSSRPFSDPSGFPGALTDHASVRTRGRHSPLGKAGGAGAGRGRAQGLHPPVLIGVKLLMMRCLLGQGLNKYYNNFSIRTKSQRETVISS